MLLHGFVATRKKFLFGLCAGRARHSFPLDYFFRVAWALIAAPRRFRFVVYSRRSLGSRRDRSPVRHSLYAHDKSSTFRKVLSFFQKFSSCQAQNIYQTIKHNKYKWQTKHNKHINKPNQTNKPTPRQRFNDDRTQPKRPRNLATHFTKSTEPDDLTAPQFYSQRNLVRHFFPTLSNSPPTPSNPTDTTDGRTDGLSRQPSYTRTDGRTDTPIFTNSPTTKKYTHPSQPNATARLAVCPAEIGIGGGYDMCRCRSVN